MGGGSGQAPCVVPGMAHSGKERVVSRRGQDQDPLETNHAEDSRRSWRQGLAPKPSAGRPEAEEDREAARGVTCGSGRWGPLTSGVALTPGTGHFWAIRSVSQLLQSGDSLALSGLSERCTPWVMEAVLAP